MAIKPAALKPLLFLLCLLPLAWYANGVWQDTLGANPIEALIRGLGTWALNFLLITLTVTPLRKLTGWGWLMPLRRMLGLFCFFYALLHWGSYLWLDQSFDWAEIVKDVYKRPFITVGMVAFVLLLPHAATSNSLSIRRLGGKRWQELHRSVYVIAIFAVLHYGWMVKLDISGPLLYAAVLVVLLGARAWWRYQEMQRQRAGAYAKPGRRVIPIVIGK
jgi:sulfoxide reductase heme-binding subunit YedZ